ncbi:MAG: MlaD family protein [Vicinamibacterales bacterium]
MPRTRSLAWAELKIGILAVFAAVMAAVMVFAVGGSGGFFWQRYPLKAHFANIATVKSGTPVRVAGIEVGVVTAVVFAHDGVDCWFELSRDVRPLVTTRSVAVIGSVSMLGEGAIDITAAPAGTPLPDWGYVPSGVDPSTIPALSAAANEGLNETTRLIADLRAGRGTLGRLVTDESAYQDVGALLQAATRVADALRTGRGTMGRLVNDPQVYRELAARPPRSATSRVAFPGRGRVAGALLQDPALACSATAASGHLETVGRPPRAGRGHGREAAHRRAALRAPVQHGGAARRPHREAQHGPGHGGVASAGPAAL